MNRFQIKILACTTMLIDHVGAVLIPYPSISYTIFRTIGRLAFPLFAWMIAEGYFYTRDRKRYVIRLTIFALISQWPFFFAFSEPTLLGYLNIGVTLVLGFCAIWAFDAIPSRILGIAIAALLGVVSSFIHCDSGLYGFAMIFIFYLFREKPSQMFISQIFLGLLYTFSTGYFSIQIFSLFSLLFIYIYNEKKGADSKWFFYGFYPIHLLIIGLISQFL